LRYHADIIVALRIIKVPNRLYFALDVDENLAPFNLVRWPVFDGPLPPPFFAILDILPDESDGFGLS
jgi:hypothetical protein